MKLALTNDTEFIEKLTEIILENLKNQNFGVKELEKQAGMGRKSINHRLHSIQQKTINEYIRETRLLWAKKILVNETVTAREAAARVGFGSPAYFNTCFHKRFGYPPGESKKRYQEEISIPEKDDDKIQNKEGQIVKNDENQKRRRIRNKYIIAFFAFIVIIVLIHFSSRTFSDIFRPGRNVQWEKMEKSIAVLPFKNISDDPENLYLTEGIMDEIHSHLCRINDLKIISRTSVEQFRNSSKTVNEIADLLGVNFLLEGTVQRYRDRLRIHVSLIDARHDLRILAESFDKNVNDIFYIQNNIANIVAVKLKTVLSEQDLQVIKKIPVTSTESYAHYIKGRYFLSRMTEEGIEKSIEYFEKSISLDPDYASAYAGMADAYFVMSWWGKFDGLEGYEKAKQFAGNALRLDKNLSEAHAILGRIYCYYEWKWEEAEEELTTAIELNPNNATAYYYYSELLDITGHHKEAIELNNKAIELDPFSFNLYSLNSLFYFNLGDFENSLEYCRKTLELNPGYMVIYWRFFRIYFYLNEDKKAVEALQKIMSLDSGTVKYASVVTEIYERDGMNGLLNWLISLNPEIDRVHIARIFAMLGKKSEALDYLEKGMEDRIPNFCRIISYFDFKNLFHEPRFRSLVEKAGLTDYFEFDLAASR